MKQKYFIWKNVEREELLIQEYAMLTAESKKQKHPGMMDEDFSLLCEQTYHATEVKKATSRGKDELILLLRNEHFFPIGLYMEIIANAVITMYESKGGQQKKFIFDDKEVLLGTLKGSEMETKVNSEKRSAAAENLDDLIEDGPEYNGNVSNVQTNHEQFNEESKY